MHENTKFLLQKKNWGKQRVFIPRLLLLKSLSDIHSRKYLLLFKKEKKKQSRFCGHNFTLECWNCWTFLRQDYGKGKPWNDLAKLAKYGMGPEQFRALCEKWQDLHWGYMLFSQNLTIFHGFGWEQRSNHLVFAHKYPPKYLGWEGSVLGDGDWK